MPPKHVNKQGHVKRQGHVKGQMHVKGCGVCHQCRAERLWVADSLGRGWPGWSGRRLPTGKPPSPRLRDSKNSTARARLQHYALQQQQQGDGGRRQGRVRTFEEEISVTAYDVSEGPAEANAEHAGLSGVGEGSPTAAVAAAPAAVNTKPSAAPCSCSKPRRLATPQQQGALLTCVRGSN